MKLPKKTLPHIASAIASVAMFVFLNGVFDLLDAHEEVVEYKQLADPMIREYMAGKKYDASKSSMDQSFFVHRNFSPTRVENEQRNFKRQILISMNIALVSLIWLMVLNKPKPTVPTTPTHAWDSVPPPSLLKSAPATDRTTRANSPSSLEG
jgi:hypothetical protein